MRWAMGNHRSITRPVPWSRRVFEQRASSKACQPVSPPFQGGQANKESQGDRRARSPASSRVCQSVSPPFKGDGRTKRARGIVVGDQRASSTVCRSPCIVAPLLCRPPWKGDHTQERTLRAERTPSIKSPFQGGRANKESQGGSPSAVTCVFACLPTRQSPFHGGLTNKESQGDPRTGPA